MSDIKIVGYFLYKCGLISVIFLTFALKRMMLCATD